MARTDGASGGILYVLGLIGSAVYYIGSAETFGAGVLGFLKSLVWPAILAYEALRFFSA
jgi:hypothetical protein